LKIDFIIIFPSSDRTTFVKIFDKNYFSSSQKRCMGSVEHSVCTFLNKIR